MPSHRATSATSATSTASAAPVWRVCVTRDEAADGPLGAALRARAFAPVACPVLVEAPPEDTHALAQAAGQLARYDWIVCASARAVQAVTRARGRTWPPQARTAAVGAATARAIAQAGVREPVVTAPADGADALWTVLRDAAAWSGVHALVLTTDGGRRLLADRLRESGALVDEVEAYRMAPREAAAIARDWTAAAPDAVVIASPRVAMTLTEAVGTEALTALRCVVAIGATTAAALTHLGVPCVTAAVADFAAAADTLTAVRAGVHR